MRKLKKFNGGQIYTADFRKAWFYVGAYSQKHVIELMKEATGHELNQSTISNYWNKDAWGANNSGYTDDKRYAGVYLESNILADQSYYNNGVSTKAVLI